ncbi:cathepsinB [Heliothis virescens ascovirus 3j]|uniref:CathepsinB n=1 Tax=Heliothis virescens ascovirus 3j TaxID=1561067 RepID=A0A2Z5UZJ8_9VIRU|nr:cathepsinB [Heliothis virescens ascovirus 3j]
MDGMIYNTDISLPPGSDVVTTASSPSQPQLPVMWDWSSITASGETEITRRKKALIVKPMNQFRCGSCWAFSASTMLSDTLVISGLVNSYKEVHVSVTTLMKQAVSSSGCGGGSTYRLLERIKSHQVSFTSGGSCTEYDWCENNEQCRTNKSQLHFETHESKARYLDSLIPTPRCVDAVPFKILSLDAVSVPIDQKSVIPTNATTNAYNAVKTHILNRGTVCASMVIYDNFTDGLFTTVNGGVYQERIDYKETQRTGKLTFFKKSISDDLIRGTHSVVIVGWGTHTVFDMNGNLKPIPYWKCRNSWGEHWGDGGYFKIAQYPINTKVALIMSIDAVIRNVPSKVGGAYFVTVRKVDMPPLSYTIEEGTMKSESLDQPSSGANAKVAVGLLLGLVLVYILLSGLSDADKQQKA